MDTALKQRLIGAVILVALAVIFVPMLIKQPAPDSGVSHVPLTMPSPPSDPHFQTRELSLAPAKQSDSVLGLPPVHSSGEQPSSMETNKQGHLPQDLATEEYAVNFGAYANVTDADMVIRRVRQEGLSAWREQQRVGPYLAWRVRVGPYATAAAAQAARLTLSHVRHDVAAQVVVLANQSSAPDQSAANANPSSASLAPANGPTPATASPTTSVTEQTSVAVANARVFAARNAAVDPPAKRATPGSSASALSNTAAHPPNTQAKLASAAVTQVGFVVQVAAFSRVEEAQALSDRLHANGFPAFVDPVQSDQGILNRVRAGPVVHRSAAEQLKAQIAAKLGISGMVRTQP